MGRPSVFGSQQRLDTTHVFGADFNRFIFSAKHRRAGSKMTELLTGETRLKIAENISAVLELSGWKQIKSLIWARK